MHIKYILLLRFLPFRSHLSLLSVLLFVPMLSQASVARQFGACGTVLISTAQTLFGGLGSHVKALKSLRLSPMEELLVSDIRSKKLKIGIHESKVYERSEPFHIERGDENLDGRLVLSIHQWPSKDGHQELNRTLVEKMGYQTRDGLTFEKQIINGNTQKMNLKLEIKIDYSHSVDVKSREQRREAVLRVRLIQIQNGQDHLETIRLPVMHMAANLALQQLAYERNLSIREIENEVKPVMGGLANSSWIDYQLNEFPLSLVSILFLPKVLALTPSEHTAMAKALASPN